MKTRHIYCMIALLVLCTSSASAQWSTGGSTFNGCAQAPAAAFRSTSTMQSSNSTYVSTPTIGSDGLVGDAMTAGDSPSGPRRVGPPTPGGNPTPVGDAALPLLMLAAAYAFIRVRKLRLSATDRAD